MDASPHRGQVRGRRLRDSESRIDRRVPLACEIFVRIVDEDTPFETIEEDEDVTERNGWIDSSTSHPVEVSSSLIGVGLRISWPIWQRHRARCLTHRHVRYDCARIEIA